MKFIPFEPGHIDKIVPQPRQAADILCSNTEANYNQKLAESGPAVTAVVGDEIVFCIGKIQQWPGRHIVWALLSKDSGKYMVRIVRALRRMIETYKGDGRLELIVRADFPQGCKLAEDVLGFTFHHYEERFLPDGSDAKIFVRYV